MTHLNTDFNKPIPMKDDKEISLRKLLKNNKLPTSAKTTPKAGLKRFEFGFERSSTDATPIMTPRN